MDSTIGNMPTCSRVNEYAGVVMAATIAAGGGCDG
jgi:hypothetical protein